MRYTLDTDIATLYLRGYIVLQKRLFAVPIEDLSVAIVVAQELVAGWLPILNRIAAPEHYIGPYAELRKAIEFLGTLRILDFDAAVAAEFARLRTEHRRIGSNDLRIAAIALVNNATLLTRNLKDFEQIPGLIIEDWSA